MNHKGVRKGTSCWFPFSPIDRRAAAAGNPSLLQVSANRIGATTLSLSQLKMLQKVIALTVFVPFAVFYMKQPVKLDFLWAGLCIMGALYFMFRRS